MDEPWVHITVKHTRCAWRNNRRSSQFFCTIRFRDRDRKPMCEGLVLSGEQTRTDRLYLVIDWIHHPSSPLEAQVKLPLLSFARSIYRSTLD